ncbi:MULTISPECIES: type I-E CRISPR-associated protein Cas5/CasD [unclassified Lactobacillus]|uniref:type I-E CRISPR-associated protein Cas5/CasD n=1 Tax=unclassified Lactobacillus TaxID=2620435 RepID=UPI000EFB40BF|nr:MULTISPECIES: type I-E CRISPR-associated protein Cas5/CasD [unclassified Lactobacillus]RMC26031.1 type I-E CRISPR-associated protein Cas5/CasD [Lactobacillus sp. ESL0247]RMC29724.1 type I-E CRISPR-associated protein Cas5/CasD [Lactobacillus sp. ESL0246]RMC34129.1 type I-E CRISPR-associated protein Cas5/CasD [Lactobacillus sp. ESL0245]
MKTLTIRLTAPLQSYGNEATFERRTSSDYPSKSAIVGMIAAALGYSRDDERVQELNKLQFAVRIDQPGKMLTDFQTVEWKTGTRKITYREYLQDAVFVVAISGGPDDIDRIKYALKHPRYALFLGRRSNIPAGVLQITEFPDKDPVTALKALPWQASNWYQKRHSADKLVKIQVVADANLLSTNRTSLVKDHVLSLDSKARQYKSRPITTTQVELRNPLFKQNTQHDAMSPL